MALTKPSKYIILHNKKKITIELSLIVLKIILNIFILFGKYLIFRSHQSINEIYNYYIYGSVEFLEMQNPEQYLETIELW